jgi:hypothetical protein
MPSLNRQTILIADERAHGRYQLLLEVQAGASDMPGLPVVLHNISRTGLLIEAVSGLSHTGSIDVQLPGAGTVSAQIVWADGAFYGVRFAMPLTPNRLEAALARSKVIWPDFSPTWPGPEARPGADRSGARPPWWDQIAAPPLTRWRSPASNLPCPSPFVCRSSSASPSRCGWRSC